MKAILCALVTALVVLAGNPAHAIVGYYNYPMAPGDNFFENGLIAEDNHINNVLGVPSNISATLSLWDVGSRQFVKTAFWDGSLWRDSQSNVSEVELLPGTGARLWVSEFTTITFVGQVGFRDLPGPGEEFGVAIPPPPGVYCLGDKVPMSGDNAFFRVIGRAPVDGEQIIYQNGTTLTYGLNWFDTSETLTVGQAALFNIGPVDFVYVPEPSIGAFGLLGLAAVGLRRRWQRS